MISLFKLTTLLAVAASEAHAQCYYSANKLAGSDYIPCGDTSNGQSQSCCHLGDNCLFDGVCFSLSTGMTYIAGCTDSSYEDATCGAQQCSKGIQNDCVICRPTNASYRFPSSRNSYAMFFRSVAMLWWHRSARHRAGENGFIELRMRYKCASSH